MITDGGYPSHFLDRDRTGVGMCREFRKVEANNMTDVRWTLIGIKKNEVFEMNFFPVDNYTIINAIIVFQLYWNCCYLLRFVEQASGAVIRG